MRGFMVLVVRLHVFCIINRRRAPWKFQKLFTSRLSTRHRAYNFDIPRVTGEEKSTFYYNTIKDWNSLPDRLKACSNLLSFKAKLKQVHSTITYSNCTMRSGSCGLCDAYPWCYFSFVSYIQFFLSDYILRQFYTCGDSRFVCVLAVVHALPDTFVLKIISGDVLCSASSTVGNPGKHVNWDFHGTAQKKTTNPL